MTRPMLAVTWRPYGGWTSPPWERHLPPSMRKALAIKPSWVTWRSLAERLTTHRPVPSGLPWACSDHCSRPARWKRPGVCPRCRTAALVQDKASLPAWSPWGTHEYNGLGMQVSALVLDYDGGAPLAQLRERWAPWAHAGHTTWSHTDPDDARARVVLPLAEPVAVAMWPRLWAWSTQRDPDQDTSVGDPGRIYFLPFERRDHPRNAWEHDGPWLDVAALSLPELVTRARPADTWPRESPVHGGGARERRAHAERLKHDPDARREHAAVVGAKLRGETYAVGACCPQCGEHSVLWPIRPQSWGGCWCTHEKSCGWNGWLDQLLPADG
jgi:hypothetical protein